MLNFNGSTAGSGLSMGTLGLYMGYLFQHSGNPLLAIGFLTLTVMSCVFVVATLCRYIINFRRNTRVLE